MNFTFKIIVLFISLWIQVSDEFFLGFFILVSILWVVFLYLEELNLAVSHRLEGFLVVHCFIQRDSCWLNCFFQKCVFFVLDFDYLFEFKWMLEILDLVIKLKCSWVENRKELLIWRGSKFSYSWRTSKSILLISALFWGVLFQIDLGDLWWLFGG